VSFTASVREELAHGPPGRECCRRTEAGVVLRLGGFYTRLGGRSGFGYTLPSPSAAVIRRTRATVQEAGGTCELHVVQPGGLQRRVAYRLQLDAPADAVLTSIGLLDQGGRPVDALLAREPERACDVAAAVRGALLASASISDPGQNPHLELRAPGEASAAALADLLRRCGADGVRAARHGEDWRVVVKSGSSIAVLLARAGAHGAFLRWDQERMHRALRREAIRSANADRANLSRSVAAAAAQVTAAERALAAVEWDELDPDLREVALVRLANPEASLAELGRLLDPQVGKSTVHRRLARLHALGEEPDPG
jgi:cell division protein WhiA